MALDKIVDSSQLDADLTAVADAIRTKGGTSAQLSFPIGMAAAIAAISGGGGTLPSVITKLDGGSFTFASNTGTERHYISHNLGEEVKGFYIWSDNQGGPDNTGYTLGNAGRVLSSGVTYSYFTNADTTERGASNAIFESTSTTFRVHRSVISYGAGITYYWLAWA